MKYALINGIILDGTRNMEPIVGKTVITEGRKIIDITDDMGALQGCKLVDLRGKFLLPGLINMHVHLAGNGGNGKPQKQRDNEKMVQKLLGNPVSRAITKSMVRKFAETELLSGVTTIRTVGGLIDFDTQVRDEINRGSRRGPRILAANEAISVPGGHMAGSVAVAQSTIEGAVAQVDQLYGQKVDLIKLMITGGVMDATTKGAPGELKMQGDMVRAVCDRAHELGLKVAAHTESTEGVKVALENGVDTIEHGAAPTDEIMQLFKERKSALTVTISPALPYALFDRKISGATEVQQFNGNVVFEGICEMAKAAIANDIPICLGNDVGCPWIAQYDFWRELFYLQKYAGATPEYAIYAGTLAGAEIAGIADQTGSIEVGKDADLIVLGGNPLLSLENLKDVQMVMTRGTMISHPKVHRKAALDKELDPFIQLS